MEEDLSEAVIDVFVDLYAKGQIYRGVRMVNWDPQGLTAVSDEEVIHKEVNSKLFYVKYRLADSNSNPLPEENGWITIATTRPETILGDTAVCVHPEDERYKHLQGKRCIIPLVNRSVPIIFDTYIDLTFGTGALKVTPAHDINDYNLGVKHGLETIDTIAADGKMSAAAQFYVGEDRFVVRKKIIKDLDALGQIVKVEDIKNKVGYSERTDAVIEPRLSMQWFLKMDKLSQPALENVLNGEIKLIPEKFQNTYKHWMENVRDWCISRQLWWGQRIPAWYNAKGDFVVAKTEEQARDAFKALNKKRAAEQLPALDYSILRQDEDVLDTWFSSWLWPISVFDGFKNPDGADINYYYPTNDLVTAPEILFFWVARMIIAGYEYRGKKPFENVYLTGIVRDKQGRKMSKSLGNSPDPIGLIEKYGADGVRVGMLLCSPAGNDLPFDDSYCEQGRNFSNKIWNAFRLIKGFEVDSAMKQPAANAIAVKWFASRFSQQLAEINGLYDKYRISEVLMCMYKLVWDDFCAWYLEMIKPEFEDGKAKPLDGQTYQATIGFLENLLKVVHPFMPFISEEIWHLIKERAEKECIVVSDWPKPGLIEETFISDFEKASEVIVNIRNIRQQKAISPKEKLQLQVKKPASVDDTLFKEIIGKLANLESFTAVPEASGNVVSFLVKQSEYFVPMTAAIDVDAEKERLSKELYYNQGFLDAVLKKLENERFVQNAKPEILAIENKKQADAEAKIKAIREQLAALSGPVH
jgi:valyl-tRNA synthetase